MSKLTRDLKCIADFSPTCCSFQVLASGRMIGKVEECTGIYLLQMVDDPENQSCYFKIDIQRVNII